MIFAVLILSGCSYLPPPVDLISYLPYLDLSGPNITTIRIRTTPQTNYGAPFYVLVKGTTFPSFLTDDYWKITGQVINPDPEQAAFAIVCVVPGTDQTIKIKTPEDKSIALYCLFTNPGKVWKQIFELQQGSQTIKVELGENEISSING
jgi:hypothetical protein